MKTICKFCQREFDARRSTAQFCSSTCRAKHCLSKPAEKKPNPVPVQNLRGVVSDSTAEISIPSFDYKPSKGFLSIDSMAGFALANKQAGGFEKDLKFFLANKKHLEKLLFQLESAIKFLMQKPESKLPLLPINKVEGIIKPTEAFQDISLSIGEFPGRLIKEILLIRKQIDTPALISIFSVKYNAIRDGITLMNKNINTILDYAKNPFKQILFKPVLSYILPFNLEHFTEQDNNNINVNNACITLKQHHLNRDSPSVQSADQKKVISSNDLMKMDFKSLQFTGLWEEFIGRPATNFQCVVHGMPGSGKSTLAIQFALYLAKNHGLVVYISGEEGFGKTLKDKFDRMNAMTPDLHIADLRSYDDIIKEIPVGKYPFIFIDSLDNMHIDADKLKLLRARYKDSAIITISQSTKDGKMRGSLEIIHDAGIEIVVSNGLAVTNKNRFNETGREYRVI